MAEANSGHAPGYGDDVWTAARCRPDPGALRDRLRGVLRLQRHARQLARARLALPVVSLASSATSRRTWRRTSAARRSSSPTARRCCTLPGAEREDRRRRTSSAWCERRTDIHYPEAEGGEPHPGDRSWAPSTRPTRSRRSGPRAKSLGLRMHMDGARFANAVASLGCRAQGDHLAGRRRRALLRRHQERDGGGGSGRLLRPGAGARVRLSVQAGRPARVQDALPVRAMGGDAAGRRLAAECPRTPTGWPSVFTGSCASCRE